MEKSKPAEIGGFKLVEFDTVEKRGILDMQPNETRKVVYRGGFHNADVLLTRLIKKAKKQIFIMDPNVDSPLLKFIDKANKNVQIIVACPIRGDTIEKITALTKRVRIIPDNAVKDYFLVIDNKNTYLFGFPIGKNNEEIIGIIKFIDPYIGDLLVQKYNLCCVS